MKAKSLIGCVIVVESQRADQHTAVWRRFEFVANDLLRAGEGKVRCLKCDETFPTGILVPKVIVEEP